MKKLVAVIAGMIICLTCRGQENQQRIWKSQVGIDIGAAVCEGGLKVNVSQQFAHQWSLDASSMIRIGNIARIRTEKYIEHYETLGYHKEDNTAADSDLVTGEIKICHWLKETFIGPHIHIGCRSGVRQGLAGTVGAGYCIQIWKGLSCRIT